MTVPAVLDAAGRRRSPATMPGYHAGGPPRNKGRLYPADRGRDRRGHARGQRRPSRLPAPRLDRGPLARRPARRGGARAGRTRPRPQARVSARAQRQGRPAPRHRHGRLGLGTTTPWLAARLELPVGPLFCVIDGPTRGRPWSSANARVEFRRLAAQASIRRRFAPHQLRHAHAVELAREGVPLNVIQHQLGHANLGTTSIYLQGIDTEEIIATVRARRAPMTSASAGLQL